jgi:hypothetical protein
MAVSMLFGIILYLLIGISLSAIILRAAVALANYFLSFYQSPPATVEQAQDDHVRVEAFDRDLSNPFSPPGTISENWLSIDTGVIPTPSFGRAYVITLVQSILFLLSGGVVSSVLGEVGLLRLASLISIAVSFFVGSAVLSGLAPTSFPRAMFVTFLSFGIIFLVMFAVGITVFGLRESA